MRPAARASAIAVAISCGGFAIATSASLGCVGDQVAAIEAESEAKAALYQAERGWVEATIQLADVLTALALGDIELPEQTKAALRAVAERGRRALLRARAELALGVTGEPFEAAVAELIEATLGVKAETRGLLPWIP